MAHCDARRPSFVDTGYARLLYERTPENEHTTSSVGNTITFQGHEYDPDTGLVHFRNRDYSPELGRFLQPDPMGYMDSPNPYQAFGNNPVNMTDPMGLYQTDVHHLLTQYLALRAGFSEYEADKIAKADEGEDQNEATEAIKNARKGRWNTVQQHHFPLDTPTGRVTRNSASARRGVENATTAARKAPWSSRLEELGAGLHLLQDSYSHEGAYFGNLVDQRMTYGGKRFWAISNACDNAENGIFHPDRPEIESRADTKSTDETYRDVLRTIEMSHATFDALVDFRLQGGVITLHDAQALKQQWGQLGRVVQEFAAARTKQSKKEWQRKYAPTVSLSDADLDDMSIPKK